jgi:hypothetical protein
VVPTDWKELAITLGALSPSQEPGGWNEAGGHVYGCRAIAHLLGEPELENAIEWCVDLRPGQELARSVLNIVRSDYAIDRCYQIAMTDSDMERRRMAVYTLAEFATARTLPWVRIFLQNDDPGMQNVGAGLLDQLVFREAVEPEGAEPYILEAENHTSSEVQRMARLIRECLRQRSEIGIAP